MEPSANRNEESDVERRIRAKLEELFTADPAGRATLMSDDSFVLELQGVETTWLPQCLGVGELDCPTAEHQKTDVLVGAYLTMYRGVAGAAAQGTVPQHWRDDPIMKLSGHGIDGAMFKLARGYLSRKEGAPEDGCSRKWFTSLFVRKMLGWADRTFGNQLSCDDVLDAVEHACKKALRTLSAIRAGNRVWRWQSVDHYARSLRTSARSSAVDRIRKIEEPPPGPLPKGIADKKGETPSEAVTRNDLLERVSMIVQGLSPKLREVYDLVYCKGLSTRDAARRAGASDGTMRQDLCRLHAKLRQRLGGERG